MFLFIFFAVIIKVVIVTFIVGILAKATLL